MNSFTFVSAETGHRKQWHLALAAGLAISTLGVGLSAAHAQTGNADLRGGCCGKGARVRTLLGGLLQCGAGIAGKWLALIT